MRTRSSPRREPRRTRSRRVGSSRGRDRSSVRPRRRRRSAGSTESSASSESSSPIRRRRRPPPAPRRPARHRRTSPSTLRRAFLAGQPLIGRAGESPGRGDRRRRGGWRWYSSSAMPSVGCQSKLTSPMVTPRRRERRPALLPAPSPRRGEPGGRRGIRRPRRCRTCVW